MQSFILPAPCVYHDGERSPCKINSITVDGLQDGAYCQLSIEEVFENTDAVEREIRCLYPIGKDVCLYGVTFKLGDEVIDVKLEGKQQAQEVYDEAVSKGQSAVIGTRLNDKVVEFVVGNVQPNVKCVLVVKSIWELMKDGDKLCFRTKMMLSDARNGSIDLNSGFGGDFKFEIKSCQEGVTIENGLITTAVSEVNIQFTVPAPATEMITSARHAILTAVAEEKQPQDGECDYVFIVDCSGSMSGSSIGQARDALKFFLRSLPAKCRFEIVRFGSSHQCLFSKPTDYNEASLKTALTLADNMQANLGGTELMAPLKQVLSTTERATQIFLLTDGQIYDTDSVIATVAQYRSRARIFCLGIGSDVDTSLVERLAKATMGRADFTRSGDMAEKVLGQLESAMGAAVVDVEVHIEGADDAKVAPFPIPPAYIGVPSHMIVECTGAIGEALVSGKINGAAVDIPVASRPTQLDENAIQALFAFKMLEDLNYSRLVAQGNSQPTTEIEGRMVELSIRSGVLCDFTSFIGVSAKPAPEIHHAELLDMMCCNSAPASMCYCAPPDMLCESAAPMRLAKKSKPKAKKTGGGLFGAFFGRKSRADDECEMEMAAPPPPRSAPKSAPRAKAAPPKSSVMDSVIGIQNVGGWWESVNDVLSAAQLQSAPAGLDSGDEKQMATLLAIAVLRKLCSGQAAMWRLIERKATSWLSSTYPDLDIEQAIAKISI